MVAVAAMTPEPTVAKAAELLYSGKMYTPEEIRYAVHCVGVTVSHQNVVN